MLSTQLSRWCGVSPASIGRYFYNVGLPAQANEFRKALPGIFDQIGHERRIIVAVVDAQGSSIPVTFSRELDKEVRLDFGGSNPRTIILNGTSGQRTSEISTADETVLDSLATDRRKAFSTALEPVDGYAGLEAVFARKDPGPALVDHITTSTSRQCLIRSTPATSSIKIIFLRERHKVFSENGLPGE